MSTKKLGVNAVSRGEIGLLIMIGVNESPIVIGKNKKVYLWRKEDEKYSVQLVCPPS